MHNASATITSYREEAFITELWSESRGENVEKNIIFKRI